MVRWFRVTNPFTGSGYPISNLFVLGPGRDVGQRTEVEQTIKVGVIKKRGKEFLW